MLINRKLIALVLLPSLLAGCGSTIILGDMPQTPEAYVAAYNKPEGKGNRQLNLGFEEAVKKLQQISKQCYQFTTITKSDDKEMYRDVNTSKVTMLGPDRAVFTMQEKRISGPKVIHTQNDELKDGVWQYAIVVDRVSENTSNARLYYPVYFYEDIVNTVVDAAEGKFGTDCPPKEDRIIGKLEE